MNSRKSANISLVFVVMFWGASTMLTKVGLQGLQEFNLVALRFTIAFFVALIAFSKRIDLRNRQTLVAAGKLSVALFIVFTLFSYGARFTTASNAGFLTCLAGVFVPIVNYFAFKEKLQIKTIGSIILAVFGVGLLTLSESLVLNVGDLLCVLTSVAFAVHIIATNRLAQSVDPLSLGVAQLGFVGLYSLICTFIFETPHLPASPGSWLVVLALSLLCTGFAFIIQTLAQKHTTATFTGLVYTLEPAFAAFFAFAFLGEVLHFQNYMGALLLLVSIVATEVNISDLKVLLSPSKA